MKIKLNIDGWDFTDLYKKTFWKELGLEKYIKSYDILWDTLPKTLQSDLFYNTPDIFFCWLDSLPDDMFITVSDKIFAKKKDIVDFVLDDPGYYEIMKSFERSENPWVDAGLDTLFYSAEKYEAAVIMREKDVVITGFNKPKVDNLLSGYLFNGYYIADKIEFTNKDIRNSVYILVKNIYAPLIGTS